MKRRMSLTALAALVVGSGLSILPGTPASATAPPPVTGRASVLAGAVEPAVRGDSGDAFVSGNGRYVVFSSRSRLVPADADDRRDVYVKDLLSDAVERISVTPSGAAPSDDSRAGAITPDGRFVVFWSWAANLVAGDTKGKADVFVRDRKKGTTERVSLSSAEQEGTGASPSTLDDTLDLSSDGRYVVFTSSSTNFGADGNTLSDVFVRDRQAGTTELLSVSSTEVVAGSDSYGPSMSADGRYVAFESDAANLITGDSNAGRDIFVRDRQATTTLRASLHDNDTQAVGQSYHAWIDDGGAKVAFASGANLTATDTNTGTDVYVRDRTVNSTTLVSVGTGGAAVGGSSQPRISGDGAAVAFVSTAANLVAGGSNGWQHAYVRSAGATTRVSVSTGGAQALQDSFVPSLSTHAEVVAFDSKAANLVTGDTGYRDAFFRRIPRLGPFTDLKVYVQHVLTDVNGVVPSAGTVAAAVTAISAGASPDHYLTGLVTAPGFAGSRPQLIRLYVAYFKRLPDLGGLNYWLGKLSNGSTLNQVSAKFAASSEFTTKYGNTTNSQFVALVYTNVFDRQPDAAGLAYWVKKLQGGMSRGTVMTAFSESSEGRRVFSPQVHATLFGLGLLRKIPTGTLLTSLTAAIAADGPEGGALVVLSSSEYLAAL